MITNEQCRQVLAQYRAAVVKGKARAALKARARDAYLRLGGDPHAGNVSLSQYDHVMYGPFLGVSDEGSAAPAIREAAMESPKARALSRSTRRDPLAVGVAVDAERLGGIGEIAVGPDEYAAIWLASVERVLITTNIGTRVNMRVYRREPRVIVRRDSAAALKQAKREIADAFRPFVQTPDGRPRPLTVFVDIPRFARLTRPRRQALLKKLAVFVASGKAAGKRTAPRGHALGLVAWVGRGPEGRDVSLAAIDLASRARLRFVLLDGVKRKAADRAISLAGLLDYFPPGIVGPLLREAADRKVQIRTANLPDTDTIARGVWAGLNTARSMGVNLGKYGCFPLTLSEIDHVVEQIQGWFPDWAAAPVFFVDQGLLREGAVDVERDLPRGIETWLSKVARHGVRVVLIDTIDKATGRRLLKKSSADKTGYLGPRQLERIEMYARRLGVKVLWAGGLGLRDAFEMGKRGVFGIYVTSAAATTIPVGGVYVRDPALAGVKEPSKEAVLRTKLLLEAGFLAKQLEGDPLGARIHAGADNLLSALDQAAATRRAAARAVARDFSPGKLINAHTRALTALCASGWRAHWKARAK
jgi:hypothetical protein